MAYSLFDYYKARRSRGMKAGDAFELALIDAAACREPFQRRKPAPLTHGDILRGRDATGQRRTFVISIQDDDDTGPPWKHCDGHGPVSDWTSRDKLPGERILNQDRRSKRYYDFAEAVRIAKRDKWGLSPEAKAELAKKLGREPTRGQIAAEAARLDFEFLRDWCNDQWRYVGVVLIELPRDEYTNPRDAADSPDYGMSPAALWGIESCAEEYLGEVALELFAESLTN